MPQPAGRTLYLVADKKLFLGLKLGEHIVLFGHGQNPLPVPGEHKLGDIPLHSRRVARLKITGPVHGHLFAVPVHLVFAGVKADLVDAQVVHAKGVEDVVTALLKLADQVAPL